MHPYQSVIISVDNKGTVSECSVFPKVSYWWRRQVAWTFHQGHGHLSDQGK